MRLARVGSAWRRERPPGGLETIVKLLFTPFRIAGGVLAGLVSKRVFDRTWRLIDDREVPDPTRRGVGWGRLAAALLLEGAIFRAAKGLFDHGSRRFFRRLTGRWPGEEGPEEAA